MENLPVVYYDALYDRLSADLLLSRLINELDWIQHDKVPRKEYYFNNTGAPYSYGRAEYARVYESQPPHPAINVISVGADVFTHSLLGLPFDDIDYNACFLNRYDDGKDHLGWHADDNPQNVTRLTLGHGSLCIMPAGFQQTHQHRIPKHGGRLDCGPRVSLTFRHFKPV